MTDDTVHSTPPPDWVPLDPDEHQRQLDALHARLAPAPKRILDIGCGNGRVAHPLAADGHAVFALDPDPEALAACAAPNVTTILADARAPHALDEIDAPIDAALCLGNTFLYFADPDEALDLLTRLRILLSGSSGGFFAIDAFPRALWQDVADGNWQEGLSEDGSLQLIWSKADSVIALREGARVDDSNWDLDEHDTPLRLWSLGDLRLLARAAGFAPPMEHPREHLIIFRPHDPSTQH